VLALHTLEQQQGQGGSTKQVMLQIFSFFFEKDDRREGTKVRKKNRNLYCASAGFSSALTKGSARCASEASLY
jgi:hypothetical protein